MTPPALLGLHEDLPADAREQLVARAAAQSWSWRLVGDDAAAAQVLVLGEDAFRRRSTPSALTVVLSSRDEPRHLASLLEAGAFATLAWPRDRDLLEPSVTRFVGIAAERRQAAQLAALIDLAPEPLVVKDAHGRYTLVNLAAARFYETSKEDLLQKTLRDLQKDPRRAGRIQALDEEVLRDGKSRAEEVEAECPRGIRRLAVSKHRTWSPTGEVEVATFMQDVTDRRCAEEALEQQHRLLRLTLDASPYPIALRDADGDIVLANEATARLVGKKVDELIGLNVRDLNKDRAEAEASLAADREALASGRDVNVELSYITPNGEQRHFLSTRRPFRGTQGEPLIIIVSTDITDRKRMEMLMEQSAQEALSASRAKSQFVASMSHEIRTPLNGILGMTQLACETAESEEQRGYLSSIRASGQLLLDLVNRVLDLSKIESGKLILENEAFSLSEALNTVCRGLALQATSKGLQFELVISPALPANVFGDRLRLQQIVANLAGNAVKFTQRGRVAVQVAPSPAGARRLLLTVEDTGIGIPAEARSRLFERFTQADASTTRRFGGTGLGLAIARSLVELMKGRICMESAEGVGTVFYVDLPLDDATAWPRRKLPGTAPADDSVFLEDPAVVARRPNPRRLRVLVAEDNDVNARIAEVMLTRAGHTVVRAHDGLEVLRLSHDPGGKPFDAILMDLHMPHLDGVAATRALRESEKAQRSRRVPIIALTASALNGDAETCHEAGMDGYLTKPLVREELLGKLEALGPTS